MFRWNKSIDINEPTQKAIIVHDAGQEDLLLQVKYEGPLEEFGWLIPVPSLPTVEKGSMRPFYELSRLTQQWGMSEGGATHGGLTKGARDEPVKVIEVKTVGAYKVSILSAQDAGSLERWLKRHDYSIPGGKTQVIDEYIRRGWHFVAAKIDLRRPVGLQKVSGAAPKNTSLPAKTRKALRKQLASGELHPLLISFDTPKCIYPLRISAVAGKPSEVSLYVLSAEALLDKFIFHKDLAKLQEQEAEGAGTAKKQAARSRAAWQEVRRLRFATMMYSVASSGDRTRGRARDLSTEELEALGKEPLPGRLDTRLHDVPYGLVQRLQVPPQLIPASVQELPRLKGRTWFLTKQVCTFRSGEMHDLEFQPAISVLAATLPERPGNIAASVLASWGPAGVPVLLAACRSTNALQRINASSALSLVRDPGVAEMLPTLFKDDVPEVRFNALLAAEVNGDTRLVEPLRTLFRDPYQQVGQRAAQGLCLSESSARAPLYLALLRDPNPDVQLCALRVLAEISLSPIPRADLLRLLGSPRLEVVSSALDILQQDQTLEFLARRRNMDPPYPARRATNLLSSAEAGALSTNQLPIARLAGLEFLRQNADAKAVELTLPLLRDTNLLVRNRAFELLRTVSGQDIPQNDPAKWEQWWAANKDTFVARKPAQ